MANAVLFFGAGASAPFGIPTMQQMVEEFEKSLSAADKAREERLYREIRAFLANTLGRPVDLEAVFTIVDSIVNWSPDRMGIAALYHATNASAAQGGPPVNSVAAPPADVVETARALEADFERFVQNACQIREGSLAHIDEVYRIFFDYIGGATGGAGVAGQSGRSHNIIGSMFTTNYDPVLEHYWLDVVRAPLETGFTYDNVAGMPLSNPRSFLQGAFAGPTLRLYKLHGSITWYMDDYGRLTEQRVPPQGMRTVTGRKFTGQVMLYPIEEKDLFVEPYQTMFLMLNRELAEAKHWVVVGYSFGDRILREIFLQNSRKETNLIVLHPHATNIVERLVGFRGSKRPLDARFGAEDFAQVMQQVQLRVRAG